MLWNFIHFRSIVRAELIDKYNYEQMCGASVLLLFHLERQVANSSNMMFEILSFE